MIQKLYNSPATEKAVLANYRALYPETADWTDAAIFARIDRTVKERVAAASVKAPVIRHQIRHAEWRPAGGVA